MASTQRPSVEEMIAQNERMTSFAQENEKNLQNSQPTKTVVDLDGALKMMRELNPRCNDDQLLLRMLNAHINGESMSLTPEEIMAAGGQQVYMPVGAPDLGGAESGFAVKHSFWIKEDETQRECVCVKVVESPEILGVHNLISESELEDLREAVESLSYRPALSTVMRARVEGEEELREFVVPNDNDDLCLSSPTECLRARDCEVASLARGTWLYELLRSRVLAVCPRECEGLLKALVIERYQPGQQFLSGHFSHQRLGAVVVPLETLPAGGLSLLSIGLQLTPLAGLGLWIPSRYGPPVPDLRTDFAIENPNDAVLHLVVALVEPPEEVMVQREAADFLG